MSYSNNDLKTEAMEKKTLKFEKIASNLSTVNVEMKSSSELSNVSYKVDIQHSDMLVIQRLVDV